MNRRIRPLSILAMVALSAAGCASAVPTTEPARTAGPAESATPSAGVAGARSTARAPSAPATSAPSRARPSPAPRPGQPSEDPVPLDDDSALPVLVWAKAYFLLADDLQGGEPKLVPVARDIPEDAERGEAVMLALLAGPTDAERERTELRAAVSTAIPDGTELLALEIEDGLATVDLSRSFVAGVDGDALRSAAAQVVYTLTQLPAVERVAFRIDGEAASLEPAGGVDRPVGRADFVDQLPPIFVDSPSFAAPVETPIAVSGVANVRDGRFVVMVEDADGRRLVEQPVTVGCGSGCWGEWNTVVDHPIEAGSEIYLSVWEPHPEDGGPTNWRRYPIYVVDPSWAGEEAHCGC